MRLCLSVLDAAALDTIGFSNISEGYIDCVRRTHAMLGPTHFQGTCGMLCDDERAAPRTGLPASYCTRRTTGPGRWTLRGSNLRQWDGKLDSNHCTNVSGLREQLIGELSQAWLL